MFQQMQETCPQMMEVIMNSVNSAPEGIREDPEKAITYLFENIGNIITENPELAEKVSQEMGGSAEVQGVTKMLESISGDMSGIMDAKNTIQEINKSLAVDMNLSPAHYSLKFGMYDDALKALDNNPSLLVSRTRAGATPLHYMAWAVGGADQGDADAAKMWQATIDIYEKHNVDWHQLYDENGRTPEIWLMMRTLQQTTVDQYLTS